MYAESLLTLALGTIIIAWASQSSLRNVRSHGFYRFFAWEFILVAFTLNMNYWFSNPFSFVQIISWVLLITSLIFIFLGVQLFLNKGKIDQNRNDPSLVGIEKTTELITTGIYHYIRHPFYSSLLFLEWGIFFKHPAWTGMALGLLTTVSLIKTARTEENENIAFFGSSYQEYMKNTKMFIPFIF
jgi:protein-S-isoprenylcysteine O-methyltransferase Ste14